MALSYGPVAPAELDELDALLGPALHFPGGTMRSWITDQVGLANMRAVRSAGRIVAGLGGIPISQWFGGRAVPCSAVTAVGAAPDVRGGGVGALMLREHLAELRRAGVPLACLYPATLSFYRGGGYERAGYRITYQLPLGLIEVREAEPVELVPFGPERFGDARRLYAERCARTTGHIERPDWMWAMRLEHKERQPFRFLAVRGGRAEGYISFTVGGRSEPVAVADVVALTPAAGRRFLQLLAGYRSVIEHAVWNGGPHDALVQLLAENLTAGTHQRVGVRASYDWMLRIVDVAAALEARGYRAGARGQIEIEVVDAVLPENSGRYIVAVADGRASVRPGGAGAVRCDIRALAVLYTGFIAPEELQAIGQLSGPPEQIAALGALLSGPAPWMPDIF